MNDRLAFEARLDAILEAVPFPVRSETLEQAWHLTAAEPSTEILVIVTFLARPGRFEELEQAAREFVGAAGRLEGGLFSALYRSPTEPLMLTLVERFEDQSALDRHMRADYFQRFQVAQSPLLSRPADAAVLRRLPVDLVW
jgi:quinol monooxygenase YgiN